MTPSERNALLFLSVLLLVGVGVRVTRERVARPRATAAERVALAEQMGAVDSVRVAASVRSRKPRPPAGSAETRTGQTGRTSGARTRRSPVAAADPPLRPAPSAADSPVRIPDGGPTDLDLASEAEIEALPWIGPVLAARIVADRDSLGPFGSMAGFQRVRGVGPGMARRLEGRVTFSQTPRHFTVEDRGNRAPRRARGGPSARPHAP